MSNFINADVKIDKFNEIIDVLLRPQKSPYKTCFQNIPYFMRVRKRLDAEKIRKIG